MSIYGGHGIYGDMPDPRNLRAQPAIETQLLRPDNPIWDPGNFFLRLFPEQLYAVVGPRLIRASDSSLSAAGRKKAKKELKALRRGIRRYFGSSQREPDRPPKLMPVHRRMIHADYDAIVRLVREWCRTTEEDRITPLDLNELFENPGFLLELFKRWPFRQVADKGAWERLRKRSGRWGLSRHLCSYLGMRYGVGPHTIERELRPQPHGSEHTRPSCPSSAIPEKSGKK
jgi:hypothetical protein